MNSTARFFVKLAILALPLSLALLSYVVFDPFMVLRAYPDYNANRGIELNRDFVSTQVYLNQAPTNKHDSFIFGNSRSLAFLTEDWSPWIGSKAAFHFDAWFETLYGVAGKFRLLDRQGARIDHALLIVDSNLLAGTEDRDGLLFMKHPAVSGHAYAFHALLLKTYLSHVFLFPYLGKKVGWGSADSSESARKVFFTPAGNNVILVDLNRRLAENESAYYSEMSAVFGDSQARVETIDAPAIGPKSLALLREIKEIATRHKTDLRIVVSPLYDEVRLNPEDLKVLRELFGAENISDFSGANEFTANVRNYYERSHYRPHVGRALLKRIYDHAPKATVAPTSPAP